MFLELIGLLGLTINEWVLEELIEEALADIVATLHGVGFGWPADHQYVFFRDPAFAGGTVRLQAFVRCAVRGVLGGWEWGEPCPIPFADGETEKRLDPLDKENETHPNEWRIPNGGGFDLTAVEGSECMRAAKASEEAVCYLYYLVVLQLKDGSTRRIVLIAGANDFKS